MAQRHTTPLPAAATQSSAGRVSLLLDGLEIVNKQTEHVVDHGLAGGAAPAPLAKTHAPDGHLPTAMGRDDSPSIDHGGELSDEEQAIMPLRNAREIRRRRLERGRSGAIPTAVYAMARARILHKHAWCLAPGGAGDCRGLLLCRQDHPQEGLPHHCHTETIPLHALPPVRRYLCLGARVAAVGRAMRGTGVSCHPSLRYSSAVCNGASRHRMLWVLRYGAARARGIMAGRPYSACNAWIGSRRAALRAG
jgi:hypothetical protein